MVKRHPNVLILKPVDGEENNGHRKSNRELTELGSKVKAALGPESNQVKLGGIRSTANNRAVYEFATKEDRDKAKIALENCTAATKYSVILHRKPQVVIKFVPQDATSMRKICFERPRHWDCSNPDVKCCNCVEKKVDMHNVPKHGAFQIWLCPVAKAVSERRFQQVTIAKNLKRVQAAL
ncbi:hypothetical protein RvY_13957 [Ramazzottius varieornatus]|uniref:Uncharacterized protein n=1 Tax=Ramazzottius varieornatus TaxID=947166 RepID=A0A1D1VPR3_RAMVA|nr:hypothetical protein RvY_13957 [Ramazzottius varieornatus]